MKFYKVILMLLFTTSVWAGIVPLGFVDLKKTVPSLVIELRYYDKNNFIGQRVDGYEAPVCYVSTSAAHALKVAQDELLPFGLGLESLRRLSSPACRQSFCPLGKRSQ